MDLESSRGTLPSVTPRQDKSSEKFRGPTLPPWDTSMYTVPAEPITLGAASHAAYLEQSHPLISRYVAWSCFAPCPNLYKKCSFLDCALLFQTWRTICNSLHALNLLSTFMVPFEAIRTKVP